MSDVGRTSTSFLVVKPLPLELATSMTIPIYIAGVAVLGYFLYKFLYGTDTPHIKGLPEVPGLPLFGSLVDLGTNHAKVAQGWAKKYGPVFQVRMGNRVRFPQNTFVKLDGVGY
jgi:phenylacetate 2-hydroxylase